MPCGGVLAPADPACGDGRARASSKAASRASRRNVRSASGTAPWPSARRARAVGAASLRRWPDAREQAGDAVLAVGHLVDAPDDVVEVAFPASTSRISSSSALTSYLPISEATSPSAVCASCSFSISRCSTRMSPANASVGRVEEQRGDLRRVLLPVAVDAAVALLDADQAPRDVVVDQVVALRVQVDALGGDVAGDQDPDRRGLLLEASTISCCSTSVRPPCRIDDLLVGQLEVARAGARCSQFRVATRSAKTTARVGLPRPTPICREVARPARRTWPTAVVRVAASASSSSALQRRRSRASCVGVVLAAAA